MGLVESLIVCWSAWSGVASPLMNCGLGGRVCPAKLLEQEWDEVLIIIRNKGDGFHVRPKQSLKLPNQSKELVNLTSPTPHPPGTRVSVT